MKTRLSGTLLAVLAGAGLISSVAIAAPTAPPHSNTVRAVPTNFADDAFKSTWMRTDELVDNGSVKRSYFWGPTPGFRAYEQYAEGPNGQHLVQYFDKSRMEINNPNGDKKNRFYVTNGLLTRELISGQMQVGNSQYVSRWPAEINIASDMDDLNAPTYASFRNVVTEYGNNNSVGQPIVETIDRGGRTRQDSKYSIYGVKYAYFESATRHNIPDVFWQFLNQTGPVIEGGKTVNARLNDPYFYATGYPIGEAFWASVKIAGATNTAVLIQPYERRVLTFVPTAPQGFKVQMGNIGQHYYEWRYQNGGRPTVLLTPTVPVPMRACNTLPIRGFGKVWSDNPNVPRLLGCPYNAERGLTVTYQPFQHGYMLDLEGYGPNTILALFDDGTLQRFQNNYGPGEGEPEMNPPAGLYAPKKGFGKVWREGTGARVRERLGWATAPETVAVAPQPPYPPYPPGPVPSMTPPTPPAPTATATPLPPGVLPGGGAVQEFERGLMVYAGPNAKKIFVLHAGDPYSSPGPFGADHWLVFEDTFGQ